MSQEPRRRGRPKNFYEKPSSTTIQSLDRALDVLELLAANSGMTLTEIASDLRQSPATMHRVLSTLQTREVVEVDPQTQTWHIGSMAFQLGSAFLRRGGLVERSHPVMRELMEETGETSNLGIEMHGKVMFIGQVETHETIRAFFPPGTISPMHASGIGKALLSRYSDEGIGKLFHGDALETFTEKTLSSLSALKEDLMHAQERGWAFDDEEKTTGMRCVAAPIVNMFGDAVAGISISGPTHRMQSDRIESIGDMVRRAADRVSQAMGAQNLKG